MDVKLKGKPNLLSEGILWLCYAEVEHWHSLY